MDSDPPAYSFRCAPPSVKSVFLCRRTEQTFIDIDIAGLAHGEGDGAGMALLPQTRVQAYVDDGRLVRVLEDGCESFSGYHRCYPRRRQTSAAFALVVDALRWRG